MRGVDRRIARLAEEQHGLATRKQLLTVGLGEGEIEYRLVERRLIPVHRGVYRLTGIEPHYRQRVMAACLATGGAASHRCAAALFGLRGFDRYRGVDVTVEGRKAAQLSRATVYTAEHVSRTTIGLIPVTMPAQTLLGVAAVAPTLVEGAVNDVLVRRIGTLPGLVRYLKDVGASGRDGVRVLRQTLESFIRGDAPTESWLEDRVLEEMRRQGVAEPVRQYWLHLPGARRVRFDFAHPDARHLTEADGRLWHTSPSQRRRDREKDQAAAVLGWTVERITWLDLQERPEELFKPLR